MAILHYAFTWMKRNSEMHDWDNLNAIIIDVISGNSNISEFSFPYMHCMVLKININIILMN